MKTDTSDAHTPDNDPEIPTSAVFELLTERRRRYALYYLVRRVGAVGLAELAEAIALREGDRSRDRLERICTGLHHRDLPKLVDADVVRYDPEAETVMLLPAADGLAPYLELAQRDELAA